MTILDRYLLRRFFTALLLAVLAFVALFQLVNLFDRLDTFLDTHASAQSVLLFYGYDVFSVVQLVLPMAMLLAALLSLGHLVRSNELLAMRASGRSMTRTMLPLVLVAFVGALASFVMGETVVPWSVIRRDHVMRAQIRHLEPESADVRANVIYQGAQGRLWTIQTLDGRDSTAHLVTIQRVENGRMLWRVDAEEARPLGSGWLLRRGMERRFVKDSHAPGGFSSAERATAFGERAFPDITEHLEELAQVDRQPAQLGALGLRAYIDRARASGGRVQRYLTEFHMRLAWPWANVIVVLIGVALSTRLRKGGVMLSAGLALFISFSYYGAMKTGQAFGYNGALSPVVAAWIANVLFGGVAAVLMTRIER